MADHAVQPDGQVKEQAQNTPRYRVLLHHDGHHRPCYVEQVLQNVFYFNEHGAAEIALEALYNGVALCATEALELAKRHADKLTSAELVATIEPEG